MPHAICPHDCQMDSSVTNENYLIKYQIIHAPSVSQLDQVI